LPPLKNLKKNLELEKPEVYKEFNTQKYIDNLRKTNDKSLE
jgi:hypothetical protein